MRLFIGINFNKETKDRLREIINIFIENGVKGNFTRYENLHLTLKFIGNSNKPKEIIKIMEKLNYNSFNLELSGIGEFKRPRGSILWIGIKENKILNNIYDEINNNLSNIGIKKDNRKFSPHITLARKIIVPKGFNYKDINNETNSIITNIDSISLMKSERIDNKLVYTKVYKKELK